MDRRSLLDIVPIGTWLGSFALIAMALTSPLAPYVIYGALVVVVYTVWGLWRRLDDAERIAAPSGVTTAVVVDAGGGDEGPGFQEVLRALPDPVMVVSGHEPDDITGRWIVFANAAARRVFHIEEDGGLLVSAIRTPEVLECVDEALFGRINGQAVFETTGGAREQCWRALSRPLPVEAGITRLALLVVRDETDIRRMERMRADFLANASHELRTPLASLSGFIETLRGPAREDAAARDKFLAIMAAQADRMGRLIYDLLSLSRIEMNEHVPPSGEADLPAVVRDVVDGLSLIARDRGVALRVDGPPPGAFPIIGDRDQLLQVVQNLADNALKYAPAGSEVAISIDLDLSLDQAAATAGEPGASRLVLVRPDRNVHDYYARISVRDSGPGIRREHLPRLAERFYRVEGQKSGDKLGTGLGLAIVKHIVNRHRGGLTVESRSAPVANDTLMDGEKIAAPAGEGASFTIFSAWFPQSSAFGVGKSGAARGPRLVARDGERLQDAG